MKKTFIIFAFTIFLTGCSLLQPSIKPNQLNQNINQPLTNGQNNNGSVACTMEAKLCPDGSAVGRTGSNCEFAPCPAQKTGTVKGQVLLSPTCPVEKIPPEPQCAPKPFQTTVLVILSNSPSSQSYASTQTDGQGNYQINLPAGQYSLQPQGKSPLPRCETKDITVAANSSQTVNLSCDTGIR